MGLGSIRKLQDLAVGIEFDKTAKRHKNLVKRPKSLVKKPKNLRKSRICKICIKDKQRKKLLNIRGRDPYQHSTKSFDLVYSDVCEIPEEYDRS